MGAEFNHLRTICTAAVRDQVVPGLAVAVGEGGRDRFLGAFGQRQIEPEALPATPETVWDLASLTKPLVTSLLCLQAVEQGLLGLDQELGPELLAGGRTDSLTLRQVLAHAGGFPAHLWLHEGLLGPGAQGAGEPRLRAAMVERATRTPLAYPPGTRSIYSDLGYILLGDLLERHLGHRLDRLAGARLFGPLAVRALGFVPLGVAAAAGEGTWLAGAPVAATERCSLRGRVVVGEVHDLNAFAMGGVAGHAGMFGAAADVARLAHALCAAYRGAGLEAGRPPLVDAQLLRTFWSAAGVPGSTWRLGWDGPSDHGSLAGDRLARRAVGHLAFTGCSLWIDPERETFVLMLSNRVHPVAREDARFRDLRRAVNDAALEDLGYHA